MTGKLDIDPKTLHLKILDVALDMNITDLTIDRLYLDPTPKLMTLYDEDFRLSIKDFTADISAKYELMSHPTIVADIGILNLKLGNTTFAVNAST